MCLTDDCSLEETDRRTFLVSATLAATGLVASSEQAASSQSQPPETRVLDSLEIQHSKVLFKHNGKETFDGYLARPKAEGTYPAVLVIAGNRITEEYIPNTCAALALAGFVGLAPNIFHPLTDTDRTREEMQKALAAHTESDVLQDIQVGADYLRTQPFVKAGGMGVLGFCFGGRMALLYGARCRDIDAVIAYHPGPVKESEITRLKTPVQIHHGTADRAVAIEETRRLEGILKAHKTPVEVHAYEGADHGFLAYTRPTYKPDAAKLSWTRTVPFLRRHLK